MDLFISYLINTTVVGREYRSKQHQSKGQGALQEEYSLFMTEKQDSSQYRKGCEEKKKKISKGTRLFN